jgi:hypothetical protein
MKEPRWELPDRLPAAADAEITPKEAFYRRHPAPDFADAVAARRRPRGWLPAAGLVAAGAMAATLLVVVAPWERSTPTPAGDPAGTPVAEDAVFGAGGGHRHKSTLRPNVVPEDAFVNLSIVAQHDGRPVPLEDGATLTPETRIRFLYDSSDFDYLMLVNVTDAGEVSVLYPMTEGPSIPVVRGVGIPLQGAVLLDDHLGPERFFALFSAAPLAYDQVETAIAQTRKGAGAVDGAAWLRDLRRLPLDCAQATLLIEKESDRGADDG